MSKSRDSQTLAFVIAAVVVSFSTLGIIFSSQNPYAVLFGYIVGVITALFGIFFRENRIIRDFEEPDRIERPLRKSSAGFQGSFLLRSFQFLPIEAWIFYTLSSNITTVIFATLMIAILLCETWLLTKIESRRWNELIVKEQNLY